MTRSIWVLRVPVVLVVDRSAPDANGKLLFVMNPRDASHSARGASVAERAREVGRGGRRVPSRSAAMAANAAAKYDPDNPEVPQALVRIFAMFAPDVRSGNLSCGHLDAAARPARSGARRASSGRRGVSTNSTRGEGLAAARTSSRTPVAVAVRPLGRCLFAVVAFSHPGPRPVPP